MSVLPFPGFRPAALTFFRGLKRNNTKVWFEAHREQYETEVKAPLRILVEEIDARLGEVAPELTGNAKRSIFRIHRDIRFSKDKSPYKTHAACWFYHRDASYGTQSAHGGAGLYFHIEPNASMTGGGIWMPPTPLLKQIREAIAEDYDELRVILNDKAFKRAFGTMTKEAMLTRPPRGFSADHPAADLLLYKSFTATRPLTETELFSRKLPDIVMKQFMPMLPLVRWLNTSIGFRSHSRR
jgi:uncharacterized protein (TIGR02453 family)